MSQCIISKVDFIKPQNLSNRESSTWVIAMSSATTYPPFFFSILNVFFLVSFMVTSFPLDQFFGLKPPPVEVDIDFSTG